jgi:hypothetical protein
MAFPIGCTVFFLLCFSLCGCGRPGLHYTWELVLGLFFDLGGFSVADCVGIDRLRHTAMLDSMYRCGSVGVGACWQALFPYMARYLKGS